MALADGRMYAEKSMGRNAIALPDRYVPFNAPAQAAPPAPGG